MARPLRIQYENAYYHVTCRGNAREDIFDDETDRRSFLGLLARSSNIYQVEVHGFVLMTNHFHLVIKTPLANMQEFMRHFNISYTSYYNRRHNRVGHLYQGRYKSFLIDADSYLMEVSRYVHLNPVRIRKNELLSERELRNQLRDYSWSSYPEYLRRESQYPWLSREEVLNYFGGDNSEGRKAYARYVERDLGTDIPDPLEKGKGHGIVGEESFIKKVSARHIKPGARRESPAIKKIEKQIHPARILEAIETAMGTKQTDFLKRGYRGPARGMAMEFLYRYGGMKQREIGDLIGLDYSTVSVVRKRFQSLLERDSSIKSQFIKVQEIIIQE